jgi:hypothetical protein
LKFKRKHKFLARRWIHSVNFAENHFGLGDRVLNHNFPRRTRPVG